MAGRKSLKPLPSSEQNKSALMTLREVAAQLHVSERTIWQHAISGELVSIRIGRSRRFAAADVDEFIARCKTAAVRGGRQKR